MTRNHHWSALAASVRQLHSGRPWTPEEAAEHELRRIVDRFHRDPRSKCTDTGKPSRTATLFAAGIAVGPYVRDCGLNREHAENELTAAGVKEGLSERNARRSAVRGLQFGIDDPSKVPHEGYTGSDVAPLPAALPPRRRPKPPAAEPGHVFRGKRLGGSRTPKSWDPADRLLASLPGGAIAAVLAEGSGAPVSLTRWPSFDATLPGERFTHFRTWGGLLDALPLEAPPETWPRDDEGKRLPVDEDRKKLLPLVSFADWPTLSRDKDAPKPTTTCALVLDYDDDPAWSLDWTRETFHGLRWVAWTTANHGREKAGTRGPRGRVVVHLSRPVGARELRTLTAWAMGPAGWGRPAKDGAEIGRGWVPPVSIPTTDGGPPSMTTSSGRDGSTIDVDATLAAIAAALAEVECEEPDDDEPDADDDEPADDEPDDDTEDAPEPDPWGGVWLPLGERWAEVENPPPRRWLLAGVFPLGKVGMLAAAGGAGKTFLVFDLAVAIAVGRRWAGMFSPPRTAAGGFERGRVLVLLGEEDAEEVARRMHRLVGGLDADQKIAVRSNLYAVPLAGMSAGALLDEDGAPTAAGKALLRRVEELAPRLIILDPLARFAPAGAEVDNVIATRLVSFVEALSAAAGGASVLLVHHSSQASRVSGSMEATAARGVTGLSDAVRWQASMRPGKAKGPDGRERVVFAVNKNSYAPGSDSVLLVRGDGGELRRDPQYNEADLKNWEAPAVRDAAAARPARSRGAGGAKPAASDDDMGPM